MSQAAPRLDPAAIPVAVLEVIEQLKGAGFRAVLVGGGVRDLLRGKTPKDFDVATSARPEAVQRAFRRVLPTGIDHGTVTVVHRGTHVEVTTFRAEAEYVDGRRPSKVEFHEDVDADLGRRDFTINAMAWDPVDGLIDPFGGQRDLQAKLVRCVRDAMERFLEDGLRPLRAVRFATVLGFALEPATEAAIPATLHVFRRVAGERVQQEFVKVLHAPDVARGLGLLQTTGLLGAFLPEASARFDAVAHAPDDDAVRLAVLLYPCARPREVVLRLKFPLRVAEETAALLQHRDLPSPSATDADLRRWLARVTPVRVDALIALNAALGVDVPALVDRLRALVSTHPPLTAKDLALDGQAIMSALQVPPSRLVGEASRYLLEQVLDEPARNTPEGLLQLLAAWRNEPA
jgi:tRNA nucleotidyltransferase (CCA-adding enzyme)